MLSILIPVYNYNAHPLVKELYKQALNCNVLFEILVYDDASKSSFNIENEKINLLKNCTFLSNEKNLGFSSNRNRLVSKSKYKNLLFLDGDSIVIDANYIQKYIKSISENIDVIYGGRIHPNSVTDTNKRLRWKYGKFIEDKIANVRSKKKYICLMFNNTLIKKKAFNLIKFDPITNKYGHDDTLFAYKASLLNLKVDHIDNAVMHGDIDTNEFFLKKTETALENIFLLYNTHKISHKFVRLLLLYNVIEVLKLKGFVAFLFEIIKQILRSQLLSKNPSLVLFKIYKIGYLCTLKTPN